MNQTVRLTAKGHALLDQILAAQRDGKTIPETADLLDTSEEQVQFLLAVDRLKKQQQNGP